MCGLAASLPVAGQMLQSISEVIGYAFVLHDPSSPNGGPCEFLSSGTTSTSAQFVNHLLKNRFFMNDIGSIFGRVRSVLFDPLASESLGKPV
jgi:hypothetical protein